MQIADFQISSIYGPGERFVLWVQGCSLACKNCWNKAMWNKKLGTAYKVDEVLAMIVTAKKEQGIEGVTILGGEPFQQYEEVFELIKKVKNLELSIVLYSGYEIQELEDLGKTKIFDYIDILILGRYVEEQRDINLYLRGSVNQKIFLFSDRYKNFEAKDEGNVEITINEFGQLQILGYPDDFFDLLEVNNSPNLIRTKQI